jgi:hypothetical protein
MMVNLVATTDDLIHFEQDFAYLRKTKVKDEKKEGQR